MRLRNRIANYDPKPEGFGFWRLSAEREIRRLVTSGDRKAIVYELPDFLLALSMSLRAGLPLITAIDFLAENLTGKIGDRLREISHDVSLGADLTEELKALARDFPEQIIEDLVEKLNSGFALGVSVAGDILQLSQVASEEINRRIAKQAGANETKMLIPTIFLILPITVLFAIYPSLTMLGFS
jgi:tight adherence protein C